MIQHNLHDRMHNGLGDLDLFGALHINDTMANTIAPHERVKVFWKWVFLDERAGQGQHTAHSARLTVEITHSTVFKPRVARYS